MAVMMAKLYSALRAADIPEEKAIAAAEEVAAYDSAIADLKSAQRLHTWILTFNTAMLVAVLGILLRLLMTMGGVGL